MNHLCCNKTLIGTDPCAAIEQGILNRGNYPNSGLDQGQWLLLLAQCGANATLEEISDQLDTVISLLQAIDSNTDGIEGQLDTIIAELQDVNVNLGDIIIELQAILVQVTAIADNTDGIETALGTIITLLTSIESNTDDLEALITATNAALGTLIACCSANGALLTSIEAILTANGLLLASMEALLAAQSADIATILANQINPALFGTHVIATGTDAAAIAAGAYSSWIIVRTNGVGSLVVDGLTLSNLGDSTAEEAQPQFKIPAPVIAVAGGAEYEWRTKS